MLENRSLSAPLSVMAVAISGIIWGTLAPSSRYLASQGTDMTMVAAARAFFALAGSFLYILCTDHTFLRISKNQIVTVLITGCGCYGIYAGMSMSVKFIPVPFAIVIISTYPLMTAVGSSIVNKEPPSSTVLAGGLLCLAGVFTVTNMGTIEAYGKLNITMGILWAIAAGGGTAIYSVAGRYAVKSGKIDQSTLFFYSQAIGLALIMMTYKGNISAISDLSRNQAFLIIYVGAIATLLGYSIYFMGLRGISASSASVIAMIEPVTALALSSLVLKETATPRELLGGTMILIAVLMAAWDGFNRYRKAIPRTSHNGTL